MKVSRDAGEHSRKDQVQASNPDLPQQTERNDQDMTIQYPQVFSPTPGKQPVRSSVIVEEFLHSALVAGENLSSVVKILAGVPKICQ